MIQLKNVNFTYQGAETGGLHGLDLTVPDGQVLVLCGESGCGKTTLTRLLNGLISHVFPGELTGSVTVDGRDVSHQPLYDTARLVGSVFQNPRSQFFNVDTTSEITFGCENLGLPKDEPSAGWTPPCPPWASGSSWAAAFSSSPAGRSRRSPAPGPS